VSTGVAGDISGVPPLDGDLLTTPEALAAAADGFGHTVHRPPAAVPRRRARRPERAAGIALDVPRAARGLRHRPVEDGVARLAAAPPANLRVGLGSRPKV
jgi:hypothetical protein